MPGGAFYGPSIKKAKIIKNDFGFEKLLSLQIILYGKAFTASAGPAGIWIDKLESFTIQAIRKI